MRKWAMILLAVGGLVGAGLSKIIGHPESAITMAIVGAVFFALAFMPKKYIPEEAVINARWLAGVALWVASIMMEDRLHITRGDRQIIAMIWLALITPPLWALIRRKQ